MKVQIFREHLDRINELSDSEKVFMGLLTFLHCRYPEHNLFRLYASDVRTILDKDSVGAFKLNTNIFVKATFGYKAVYYGLGKIQNLEDFVLIDIQEPTACTVQGYLIALYKHKTDWLDVQQHPLAYNQRRDFSFQTEERDAYFKSPENKYTKEKHGKYKKAKKKRSRNED